MVFVKLLVLHLNHFDGNNALATNGKLKRPYNCDSKALLPKLSSQTYFEYQPWLTF